VLCAHLPEWHPSERALAPPSSLRKGTCSSCESRVASVTLDSRTGPRLCSRTVAATPSQLAPTSSAPDKGAAFVLKLAESLKVGGTPVCVSQRAGGRKGL